MAKNRWTGAILIGVLTILALLALLIPAAVSAGANESAGAAAIPPPGLSVLQPLGSHAAQVTGPSSLFGSVLQVPSSTTLTVAIIGSPWAVLDHNDPGGAGGPAPGVFVVEAVITNTSAIPATDLIVNLDYDEDPLGDWVLLDGESPTRTIPSLAGSSSYHAYWFAQYPAIIGAGHQYTVTADAHNASPAITSDNYYGNPESNQTIQTRGFQGAGNSGVTRASHEATVGAIYTVTVDYDLGTNPDELILSPVGNDDFIPSASRLLASEVRFHYDGETQDKVVPDRLYFPTLPRLFPDGSLPATAQVTYQFMPLTPSHLRLCPFAAAGYGATDKYDQFYCRPDKGTIVWILVDTEAAVLEGHAFVDADADGVFDGGESGLAGITVTMPSATVPLTTIAFG